MHIDLNCKKIRGKSRGNYGFSPDQKVAFELIKNVIYLHACTFHQIGSVVAANFYNQTLDTRFTLLNNEF